INGSGVQEGEFKSASLDNLYLAKRASVPEKGDFQIANEDENYGYVAWMHEGKVSILSLRDKKQGLNASSSMPVVKLPQDSTVQVSFRKDLTAQPGEKIVSTALMCMREKYFDKLKAEQKKAAKK
ncbi:MAG: hypothetical protein ACXWQO_11150, partial [Bdellovibrionota bacterium]